MQRPKYCPNPNCEFHSAAPAEQNWCHIAGRHSTKRHIPYQHILQLMHTHGSMRKTARILGVSHQAISNRLQRLARLSIIE